ncbi:MAG: hypothetical protein ACW98Y_20615 [Candidatus Thorarchaeota archaeon]|jgi:hypothetical protein
MNERGEERPVYAFTSDCMLIMLVMIWTVYPVAYFFMMAWEPYILPSYPFMTTAIASIMVAVLWFYSRRLASRRELEQFLTLSDTWRPRLLIILVIVLILVNIWYYSLLVP